MELLRPLEEVAERDGAGRPRERDPGRRPRPGIGAAEHPAQVLPRGGAILLPLIQARLMPDMR